MICGSHAPKQTNYEPASAQAPPPNCPPRFCCAHDSSDKRVKGDPCFKDCRNCGIKLQSSYKDFQLCPPCSEKEEKCMICGSNAPKSNSSMPAAPTDRAQAPTSGHGRQAPPPPPAMQQPWDNGPNRLPQGDATGPKDNSRSMYGSQRALSHSSTRPNVDQYGASPQQEFHTQLPPAMSQRNSRQQPPGAPWQQNRGAMSARPASHMAPGHNGPEEGFSGFLRLVASDIWKTCSHDNHRAWEPNGQQPFTRGQGGFTRGGA